MIMLIFKNDGRKHFVVYTLSSLQDTFNSFILGFTYEMICQKKFLLLLLCVIAQKFQNLVYNKMF